MMATCALAGGPGTLAPPAPSAQFAAGAPASLLSSLCDASAPGISSRSDCENLKSEVEGQDEVTLEFSDRYQAVAVPIQVFTMSWITHVDFVLPDGRLLGATPFGVRIRNWTPAIHSVRYTFHANAEKVLGFALSQVGKPYDFVGLPGYALRLGFLHQPGSWFCSGLVEAAALKGGVDLSGHSPHLTSPAQIRASILLTKAGEDRTAKLLDPSPIVRSAPATPIVE